MKGRLLYIDVMNHNINNNERKKRKEARQQIVNSVKENVKEKRMIFRTPDFWFAAMMTLAGGIILVMLGYTVLWMFGLVE